MKIACLLRGYHYDEFHKPVSSFYNKWGGYTLDFERHFEKDFIRNKEYFYNNGYEVDYFIITNDSCKLHKLKLLVQPKCTKVPLSSTQALTFFNGLELINNYSKEMHITYEAIISLRMDVITTKCVMDICKYSIKDKVSVFVSLNKLVDVLLIFSIIYHVSILRYFFINSNMTI